MIKHCQITVLVVFFCFAKSIGYTQEITLSATNHLPINITTSIEIFRDPTAKLSLEQVATKNFEKPNKDHFIFPYSNDVFWVRFTLKNTDAQNKEWLLIWNNPLVEQLDFYIKDSTAQGFLHKQQKIITSERDKKLIDQDPKFAFQLSPHQTKIVYVKLTSKRGHYGILFIHSNESFYKYRLEDYSKQSFTNGLIFFRLFLVLTLSIFIIKDVPFRLYSFHTVLKTLAYWGIMNIMGPLFTDNPDWAKRIDFLCYNSITLGSGLFILFTLAKNKLPKWHSYLIFFIIGFTIFIDTIVFFDYQWYWLKAGLYTIVGTTIYFIILYIYCIVKQISISKYYAIPFILGLLSYFLINVRLLGWIEYKPIFDLASLFFIAEIFVFVIFLGRIFRNVERNKLLAEQKLHSNEIQNEHLKELDNLKTTFFTNISHELRTPLTLLVGPLADLSQKFPSDWSISVMQRNVARLQKLINQLLDLSKLEAGKLDIVIRKDDIVAFINQILASFESLAQSKQIIFNYSQNLKEKEAYFDADKIETIIINLLSNAFKFTPQNGRIVVNITYEADNIQLNIRDFGIGISAEKLPFIYNRFYQVNTENNAHQNHEGTGIGLALVKELVEVLKGRISVKSEVDKGTEFEIILPVDKVTWKDEKVITDPYRTKMGTELVINTIQESSFAEEHKDAPLLLIVEDNVDLRNFIKRIFSDKYQIVEAVDGQKGLEKAVELVPDIIITDLMMPILDGIGFCKGLKSDIRTSHIPVIMLTAKATNEDRLTGLELGADDYLTKPFDTNELKVRVKNLIKQRESLRLRYSKTTIDIAVEPQIKLPTMDEQFLQKAKTIIDQNLDQSAFDVEAFADKMNMSSVQLRRKLKALTNETVTEFVRNYRLDIAADMLKKKQGTVSEIAFRVGFESLPYFSKVFLEKFGKTASEWK